MSAEWPELGIRFEPERMERRDGQWQLPTDAENERLRQLVRDQTDWWFRQYERVCAENRLLRDKLTDLGAMLDL